MSTPTERLEPPNKLAHCVLPSSEHVVSHRARSHDSVVAVYPHGISFIDQMGAMEGYLTIIAAGGIAFPVTGVILTYPSFEFDWFAVCLGIMALVCTLVLRADTIAYHYQPVLFDRASAKVRTFVDEGIIWWKLWQLTPSSRIETWDWSCVRAEVVEFTVMGGAGVPRKEYALVCAITDQPGSSKVIIRVGVGLTSSHDGQAMVERWEHIRRFMRGEGPHLAPGDSLFHDDSTHKFWAALTWGQPLLGPGSKPFWTGEAIHGCWFLTIPGSLPFLILLPFTMAAGLLRWLSHAVKREPKWTKEILASVGGAQLDPASLRLPGRPLQPGTSQTRTKNA